MTNSNAVTAQLSYANAGKPQIWVGCLAAYNSGKLHGKWIDADADEDVMMEEVMAVIASSPVFDAEEWEIMDTEYLPNGVNTLGAVAAYMAAIEALDMTDAAEVVEAYVNWQGAAWADLDPSAIEDSYLGKYDSVEDYAYEYVEDTGLLDGMPENLRCYFDYAAFARDMEVGGDVTLQDGYLFRNN